MEILWYAILLAVVCIYFVLDGYDFGAGIIHLFFANTEEEKILVAKSAGLFWDFNEVWLVVAGGLLFMAFPVYYASVFSGFYLPLMILLWLMIFRAIGIELRNQFHNEVWKNFWDKSFGISSLLLTVFCGAALGNIVRGVNMGQPLENGDSAFENHYFFLPLWNEQFSPLVSNVGVLDWFTVMIGALGFLILSMHGANWIILKTNSTLKPKLKNYVFYGNIGVAVLLIASLAVWGKINGEIFRIFSQHFAMFIFPLIFGVGFIALFWVKKFKNETYGFLCTSAMIVGGIVTSFVSMFPVILPSNNEVFPSLTIYNTSTTSYGLSVALIWMVVATVLAILYFTVQKRILSGKIDDIEQAH